MNPENRWEYPFPNEEGGEIKRGYAEFFKDKEEEEWGLEDYEKLIEEGDRLKEGKKLTEEGEALEEGKRLIEKEDEGDSNDSDTTKYIKRCGKDRRDRKGVTEPRE